METRKAEILLMKISAFLYLFLILSHFLFRDVGCPFQLVVPVVELWIVFLVCVD